jgi:hypothetical protein
MDYYQGAWIAKINRRSGCLGGNLQSNLFRVLDIGQKIELGGLLQWNLGRGRLYRFEGAL